jgi:hypothetical protein
LLQEFFPYYIEKARIVMQLSDGLKHYKKNKDYFASAIKLEIEAKEILQLIEYKKTPTDDDIQDLNRIYDFLIAVARWKALGDTEKTYHAAKNNPQQIWEAISNAAEANNANDASKTLSAIMRLDGFGKTTGSTKVATAVLRFLWPEKWGVVDWRIARMLYHFEKDNWEISLSLEKAKLEEANDCSHMYSNIDEDRAIEINKLYREKCTPDLPRAADVDMAIFGLSLFAWPLPNNNKRRKTRSCQIKAFN